MELKIHFLVQKFSRNSRGKRDINRLDCDNNCPYCSTDGIKSPNGTSLDLALLAFVSFSRKSAGFVVNGVVGFTVAYS